MKKQFDLKHYSSGWFYVYDQNLYHVVFLSKTKIYCSEPARKSIGQMIFYLDNYQHEYFPSYESLKSNKDISRHRFLNKKPKFA